jgi:class 3 adenylate cyclase
LAVSPAGIKALLRMLYETDARQALSVIRVPTLIVHRQGDRVARVDGARYMAERIQGAKYVELPGSDHFPWVGDTGSVLDEVEEFVTGARHGPEFDRVLATVLFTDIVGATAKAAELGDRRWRDLLHRHHDVVREELGRFRGYEIDTAGDGFLASFDGPARGIRAACAIVTRVRELGLDVRAGLHTGECEVMGAKLSGIAVHVGARVASLAAPGEVLVSSTVKDLVAGSGLRFRERGTHQLKGVPGEWHLYSVESD